MLTVNDVSHTPLCAVTAQGGGHGLSASFALKEKIKRKLVLGIKVRCLVILFCSR